MESTSLQRALSDPLLEGGPPNPHSIVRRLAQAVLRGKGLVIVCMALGGVIAGFVALSKPNRYESSATFRFRPGSESLPVDPGVNLDRRGGGANLAKNAPFLLQAPELMLRVAERVGPERVMSPYRPGGAVLEEDGGWYGAVMGWTYRFQRSLHDVDPSVFSVGDAANMIAANIELIPYRRATLLRVAYSANNPALAEEVLAAYVEEAQQFHMQIYADREAIQLVEARHEAAKKRHSVARATLKSFLAKLELNDFMAEYNLLRERETAARQRVSDLTIEIRTLKQRIQNLRSELAKSEPFVMQESTVQLPNPKIAALETEIRLRERELIDVKIRFKAGAPDIRRILTALDLLNKELEKERKRPTTEVQQVARVPNQQHQRMTERLADAQLRLTVATESLIETKTRLSETAKRVKFLGSKLDRFKELDQNNIEQRQELRKAEADLAVARMKERLKLSNLSALSVVVPPSGAEKVGPMRKMMLLMGLLAGLGFAIGILALRAMMDTTVRSPEELETLAGLRVLACVPQLDRKNLRRHQKRLVSGC